MVFITEDEIRAKQIIILKDTKKGVNIKATIVLALRLRLYNHVFYITTVLIMITVIIIMHLTEICTTILN